MQKTFFVILTLVAPSLGQSETKTDAIEKYMAAPREVITDDRAKPFLQKLDPNIGTPKCKQAMFFTALQLTVLDERVLDLQKSLTLATTNRRTVGERTFKMHQEQKVLLSELRSAFKSSLHCQSEFGERKFDSVMREQARLVSPSQRSAWETGLEQPDLQVSIAQLSSLNSGGRRAPAIYPMPRKSPGSNLRQYWNGENNDLLSDIDALNPRGWGLSPMSQVGDPLIAPSAAGRVSPLTPGANTNGESPN